MNLFDLLSSIFKRLTSAIVAPFRTITMRVTRLFNVSVITSKLIAPLSKMVRSLISLKPQSRKDYFLIGRHYVYKKLFLVITVVLCAGVFIYFQMFAPRLPDQVAGTEPVQTDITFDYNDMLIREFSGVANIRAASGEICYTGDIVAGVCNGTGKLFETNGKLIYQGNFSQNKYSGKGVKFYPSGNKLYEGEFAENLYNGAGTLYGDNGNLQYTGDFKDGEFSGKGKSFNENGELVYEGEFAGGVYHGVGKSYSSEGLFEYDGEFYEGIPQGTGTVYNEKGKEIFKGAIRAGSINIDTLIGSDLETVEKMFFVKPRIVYSDTSCVFVFEEAGVILSADCKIMVDTWERPTDTSGFGNEFFYTPEELAGIAAATSSETAVEVRSAFAAYANTIANGWYVPDSSSDTASSDTSSTGSSGTASSDSVSSENQASSEGQTSSTMPEFIEKQRTIYFEVDKNVWQTEGELDKSKIIIKKATVFNNLPALLPKGEPVEYSDNIPPSIEDCAAIDIIRISKPTVFSNIYYEMDKQNKSFIYLKHINFGGKIVRKNFTSGDLTYKYCYDLNEPDKLLYYSAES